MRSILDFFIRKSHAFLFVLLEGLALTLLFCLNDSQKAAYLSSAGIVSGRLLEISSSIVNYFSLKGQNRELAIENAWLKSRLSALESEVGNERLALLTTDKVVAARVIDNSIRRDDNFITINKGTDDGIREGMGVSSPAGAVGVVRVAGRHYSIVLPILNSKSSLSCKVLGSDSFGFLEWHGGNPCKAELLDVPYHAQVSMGDTIVTSGYSAVFPENVMVGTVSSVVERRSEYTLKITLDLAVDFSDLGWVYVYLRNEPAELPELRKELK